MKKRFKYTIKILVLSIKFIFTRMSTWEFQQKVSSMVAEIKK